MESFSPNAVFLVDDKQKTKTKSRPTNKTNKTNKTKTNNSNKLTNKQTTKFANENDKAFSARLTNKSQHQMALYVVTIANLCLPLAVLYFFCSFLEGFQLLRIFFYKLAFTCKHHHRPILSTDNTK